MAEQQDRISRIDPAEFAAAFRSHFADASPEDKQLVNDRLHGRKVHGSQYQRVMKLMVSFDQAWDQLQRSKAVARRRAACMPVRRARARAPRRSVARSNRPGARRVTSRSAGGGSDGSDSDAPGEAGPALVWDHPLYGPVNQALAAFIVEHEVRP